MKTKTSNYILPHRSYWLFGIPVISNRFIAHFLNYCNTLSDKFLNNRLTEKYSPVEIEKDKQTVSIVVDNNSSGIVSQANTFEDTLPHDNYSSYRNYENFYQSNPIPFFSCNLEGRFTKVNTSFAKMTGYEIEELTDLHLVSIIEKKKVEGVEKIFAGIPENIPKLLNTVFIKKNGKRIIVKLKIFPAKNNQTDFGIDGFAKNITKSVRIKKALAEREIKLNKLVEKLKKTIDSSLDIIFVQDKSGQFIEVSAASKTVLGYEPTELIGKNYVDLVMQEDLEQTKSEALNILKGQHTTCFENRFYKKDGSVVYLTWSSIWDAADEKFYSIARNATDNKITEKALKSSEEKYRIIFYNHPLPMLIYDAETLCVLEANEAAVANYGYSREAFLNMRIEEILASNETERFSEFLKNEGSGQPHKGLWLHQKKNGETFYAEVTSNQIHFEGKNARLVLSKDRTQQIAHEHELIKSNERYHFLSQATSDATLDWDLVTDKAVWNEVAKKMFEIADASGAEKIEWWFNNIHEEDRKRIITTIRSQIDNNVTNWEDEYRFKVGTNYIYVFDRRYILYDSQKRPVRMIGAMQNLTERKKNETVLKQLNASLERRAAELSESNADLERFAYVASHDLQEPLRMVTSFLQLLEKRYKDKLDQKAHEYISFAVDGAERMKKLILDLLEYSRVNSSQIEKEDVDINDVLEDVRFTFKKILQETGGEIHQPALPVIKGNKTQIFQLFQNLIGNALKYKSELPPVINITTSEDKHHFTFNIADNGIGIDPRFYAKIFIIFQRLHNREQYSGTGIGLAICKKIIDKHGGKIWVNSNHPNGSVFSFTLPKTSSKY